MENLLLKKLSLSILVVGILTATNTSAAKDLSVANMIAEAEAVYQEAKSLEHAWIITKTHLKMAKTALAQGDELQAMAAAKRALLTANASVKQAQVENTAWSGRVIKAKKYN